MRIVIAILIALTVACPLTVRAADMGASPRASRTVVVRHHHHRHYVARAHYGYYFYHWGWRYGGTARTWFGSRFVFADGYNWANGYGW